MKSIPPPDTMNTANVIAAQQFEQLEHRLIGAGR